VSTFTAYASYCSLIQLPLTAKATNGGIPTATEGNALGIARTTFLTPAALAMNLNIMA
jgi:hypothetical protein